MKFSVAIYNYTEEKQNGTAKLCRYLFIHFEWMDANY